MASFDQPDQRAAHGASLRLRRGAGSDPLQEFKPYGSDHLQLDMFGAPPAQNCDPHPEDVRAELLGILAKARAAPAVPWDPKEASLYRVIFPQMVDWLPADEASRLRAEFAAELARLEAA